MIAPWNLTFAEYKSQRIAASGVDADVFCEAYSDSHLTREYLDAIADPPRDADLDLRVYDALPAGLQSRWRKFSFTLDTKLAARMMAENEAADAPYKCAKEFVKRKIAELEGIRRTNAEFIRLERLRNWSARLNAPFATDAEKDKIVAKLKRFADYSLTM